MGRMTERAYKNADRTSTNPSRPFPFGKALAVILLVVAAAFIAQLCTAATTIQVTVNGTQLSLHGAKTMQTAINDSGLPINPGDLISLRGQVLERHGGHPFHATVNGEDTVDPDLKLHDGDVIEVTDGDDIVEDYESEYEPIPYSAVTGGLGALHILIAGTEGAYEIKTGVISGEQVRVLDSEETDLVRWCYNPDVGDDKVIALTFDAGPSAECTGQILDVLADNDAKATFFWVGSQTATDEGAQLARRAFDEGHQLCTHTYSFGRSSSSTEFSSLPAEDQVDEINLGRQAIADAIGAEPSRAVRLPGGTTDDGTILNIEHCIDAEIGWTIDTADWLLPGSDAIYDVLMSAKPGDIVLCHDTANSYQTVEALQRALPLLKEQGYEFITIDEMLVYPEEEAD